jgi:hypothetical protein
MLVEDAAQVKAEVQIEDDALVEVKAQVEDASSRG